jgi:hypothetical protein
VLRVELVELKSRTALLGHALLVLSCMESLLSLVLALFRLKLN